MTIDDYLKLNRLPPYNPNGDFEVLLRRAAATHGQKPEDIDAWAKRLAESTAHLND